MGTANNFPFCSRQMVLIFKRLWFAKRCESTMVNVLVIEYWWTRKKPILPFFRHSGESRNPVNSTESGCRINSGMTIRGFFQNRQYWNLGLSFPFNPLMQLVWNLPCRYPGWAPESGWNLAISMLPPFRILFKKAINSTLPAEGLKHPMDRLI